MFKDITGWSDPCRKKQHDFDHWDLHINIPRLL